jgi:hypothetical protein
MRHRFSSAAVQMGAIALALTAAVRPAGAAGDLVSLAHLAPQLGYRYTWIASEAAVALTRPGLYVLVRTGNPLYDVNDAVESTAQAPQYRDNDIYVGSALAARLRTLALKFAPPAEQPSMAVRAAAVPHGALSLNVVPTGVSDAVIVSGTGPARAPLTITLSADITSGIPRVVLSRTNVAVDAAGKFSVKISTAPLHLPNSTVLVSATSLPGVAEAHTSFVLADPNPTVAHPVDELPRDFKPH